MPNVYAIPAAIELLESVGPEKIANHIAGLSQSLLDGARQLKIKTKTPADSRGPLVVLQMKDSEAMVKKLAASQIVCSNRMDGLRTSFHLYNTMDDVRSVLGILEKNLDLTVRE